MSGAAGWPSGFIENVGQWDNPVRFAARLGAFTVRAEPGAVVLQHEAEGLDRSPVGTVVRLEFAGPASLGDPTVVVDSVLPGVCHFLLGKDPARWRRGVRRFGAVQFSPADGGSVLSVVSDSKRFAIRVTGHIDALESDVRFRALGAEALSIDRSGAGPVAVSTATGKIKLLAPRIVEAVPGSSKGVGRYLLDPDGSVRMDLTGTEPEELITIDLQLEWSTYFGGTQGGEYITAVAMDSQNRPVIVGETRSMNFPSTPGAFDQTWNGGVGIFACDAFVSCLTEDASALVYSTFLGGPGNDTPAGVEVLASGDLLVAGDCGSGFPTTAGAWDTVSSPLKSFVARLSDDGSTLVFSTQLGGTRSTAEILGMTSMTDGRIAVTGYTFASDFPTTAGCFDPTPGNESDGFISVLSEFGELLEYSTYVGGTGPNGDTPHDIVQLPSGALAIVGSTSSTDFPLTPGAFATTMEGTADGYAFVLDIETNQLVYSTYLTDLGGDMRVAACQDGSLLVAGNVSPGASGDGFPATPGAFQSVDPGDFNAGVLRLDPTGSALTWATYLGGGGTELMKDLAVDSAGRATVVGETSSGSFPTTPGSFLPVKPPPAPSIIDLFVSRLDVDGSRLLYSTFLGGGNADGFIAAVALDPTGAAIVGTATDGGYPVTPGSYNTEEPAPEEFAAVLSKLTMHPQGVLKSGSSTPGALGPLAIGVTSMPALGATDFGLTCTSAPASSNGLLLLSLGAPSQPLLVKGFELWVDASRLVLLIPVWSNADGYSELPLVIPNQPVLVDFSTYWQYAWAPPGGGYPWSASNALEITFQP